MLGPSYQPNGGELHQDLRLMPTPEDAITALVPSARIPYDVPPRRRR